MKLARIVPLFAIVAVCSWSAQAFGQIKIATVNAAKVFNEIQETKDLKSKMENDQKNLQAQDLEKKTKLKDLQSARDALKTDAPQYNDANKQLMQAAIDYEVWQRIYEAPTSSASRSSRCWRSSTRSPPASPRSPRKRVWIS